MEIKKSCRKCGQVWPLSGFYKHKQMADGHLNVCIVCKKAYARDKDREKAEDPVLYEQELDRQRAKSKRQRAEGRHRIDPERRREAIRRHREKNRDKFRARGAVARAVKDKVLIPQPCEALLPDGSRCGKPAEAHHEDYSKPLDVNWLCPEHHHKRHVEKRREQRLARRSAQHDPGAVPSDA